MPHPTINRVASNGGGADYNHPAGGYVLKITNADDYESEGYVDISYDIAEGEHAGHYEYSNGFRRYYVSSFGGATPFEKFMSALEESNPGFNLDTWQETWDCSKLEGLLVGAVFRERLYTDGKGEDRKQPRISYCCSVDSIREGRFKMPEPQDDRVKVETYAPLSDIDLPFN